MNRIENKEEKVKHIGRTYQSNDIIWMAYSGSGIEFSFTGNKCEITITGDSNARRGCINPARFGIYMNEVRVVDDIMDQESKSYVVLDSESERTVTIQIIKLSETAMSICGVKDIMIAGSDILPTDKKPYKIEFIGDSITCGYGIDDTSGTRSFTTETEDVTKAYAYLTAKELDADYSMVSISGYGIASGYTTDARDMRQTIPQYYSKFGFSYTNFDGGKTPSDIVWNHNQFIPDVIVINLGTNDDSWCKDFSERQEVYQVGYTEFLKEVRNKNKDANILCVFGMMGDRLYPYIEKAVKEYTKVTADDKISTMKFDVQVEEDGYASDFHPSVITNQKAAKRLIERIKSILS